MHTSILQYNIIIIQYNGDIIDQSKYINQGAKMHYSNLAYASKQQKEQNLQKLNAKTPGSYLNITQLDNVLSYRQVAGRSVFRSYVEDYPPFKDTTKDTTKDEDHFLDTIKQQQTTAKSINIDKISQNKEHKIKNNVRKWFRWHYRVDIKQYLKRKYQKQAYQLPLQQYQVIRFIQNPEKPLTQTKQVLVFKQFYFNQNLKRLIYKHIIQVNRTPTPTPSPASLSSKQPSNPNELIFDANHIIGEMFKGKNLVNIFRELLKCSIQFGGLDNFIMTTSNVYVDDDFSTLHINHTSFTGLALYKAKNQIGAHQYFQISLYLTQQMLKTGEISMQDRIRFFLINCLCLIIQKDLVIQNQLVDAEKMFEYYQIVSRYQKQGSQKIADQIKQQILLNEKRFNKKSLKRIKIRQLIQQGLIQCRPLTWQKIYTSICLGQPQQKQAQKPANSAYGKKIEQSFKALHSHLFSLEPEQCKQFYRKRGLDCQLLYIPVKYRANFQSIMRHRAWWEIFNNRDQDGNIDKDKYNMFNEGFSIRILHAVVKGYYEADRGYDMAVRFRDDPVIQIIFQYLNANQIPPIVVQSRTQGERPIFFTQVFKIYTELKEKFLQFL